MDVAGRFGEAGVSRMGEPGTERCTAGEAGALGAE